jgi:large subunit ribosomal protein L22
MEARAVLRYARISPQKCRLVADTVRGADVSKALNTLKFMPKKGADLVHKVLWSAVENAQNNQGADVDDLKITRIMVDAAPVLKRFGAKAKGRGTRIVKRNSHITVVVGDGKKDE